MAVLSHKVFGHRLAIDALQGLAAAPEIVAKGPIGILPDGQVLKIEQHGGSHCLEWVFSDTKFCLLPRGWNSSPVVHWEDDGCLQDRAGEVSNESCREGPRQR